MTPLNWLSYSIYSKKMNKTNKGIILTNYWCSSVYCSFIWVSVIAGSSVGTLQSPIGRLHRELRVPASALLYPDKLWALFSFWYDLGKRLGLRLQPFEICHRHLDRFDWCGPAANCFVEWIRPSGWQRHHFSDLSTVWPISFHPATTAGTQPSTSPKIHLQETERAAIFFCKRGLHGERNQEAGERHVISCFAQFRQDPSIWHTLGAFVLQCTQSEFLFSGSCFILSWSNSERASWSSFFAPRMLVPWSDWIWRKGPRQPTKRR